MNWNKELFIMSLFTTDKEWHYLLHGKKARTMKKYRNRVLKRRLPDAEKAVWKMIKEAREE